MLHYVVSALIMTTIMNISMKTENGALLFVTYIKNNKENTIVKDKKELFLLVLEKYYQLRPGGKIISVECTYLKVFVEDFSGKSAVKHHLQLQLHMKAPSSFEEDGLLQEALYLSIGSLSEIFSPIEQF